MPRFTKEVDASNSAAMPRELRLEDSGAMPYVSSAGDQPEDIFLGDMDSHDFIKTLAEPCQRAGWYVRAFCSMRNHYHLVLETPSGNQVSSVASLQSTCTIRPNARHKPTGDVFKCHHSDTSAARQRVRREVERPRVKGITYSAALQMSPNSSRAKVTI